VRIAVVIPTLHEAHRIQDAIRSARAPGVEIIVADGGSGDATPGRAREAGARVVVSERGRARQLEAGVRAAGGADVLLFLHADTTLPPGFADALREALADPAVAGGAFGFRFDERRAWLCFVEWGVRLRLALARLPYGDQALFVRREVLEAIGGVPQAPIMEDLDLVAAMKRHGRLALLPVSAVTSARRYREHGVLRTVLRHAFALAAWKLGVDRERVARWYQR
jgi:rSAM/selenodomain-associated transferase 2